MTVNDEEFESTRSCSADDVRLSSKSRLTAEGEISTTESVPRDPFSPRSRRTFERLDSVLGKIGLDDALPPSIVHPATPKHVSRRMANCWVASVYASWVCLSLVVGCLCGVVNVGFHKMLLGAIQWIRVTPAWYIADNTGFDWWPVLHYTLTTIISSMMICKAREYMPGITSGGFTNVKLCIIEKAYIPFQVGFQRMVATSLYIGGGSPLGAEAPTLHISSAVACTVYRVCSKLFPKSFPKDAMPQIVIAGCACGMAAAYNSPLGGTLHAMEEFMDSSSSQVAVAFLAIGSVVSVWMVRIITGHKELWNLHPLADSSAELHPWMLLSIPFGLVLGVLGSLLVKSIEVLRAKWKSRGVSPMKTMVISALVTSACGVIVHLITARHGDICSPSSYLDYLHSNQGSSGSSSSGSSSHHGDVTPNPGPCRWGFGMEIWGMSTDTLQLHMTSDPPLAPLPVLIFCFFKCVSVVFAIASNGSGGAFTPSLVLGGCFGAILHSMIRLYLYGDLTDNPEDAEQYRTCVIMGMAGFFSSVVRLPLCGTLVSVEMVGYASLGDRETNLCFPILLCCMVSYVTAVHFSPDTLFELLLKQDGISEHDMHSKIEPPELFNPGHEYPPYDDGVDAMSLAGKPGEDHPETPNGGNKDQMKKIKI